MAEKLRAILGQRRHAVSRDLYDIHFLLEQGIDQDGVRAVLPRKLGSQGALDRDGYGGAPGGAKAESGSDWHRNLVHLVPREKLPEFQAV